MCSLLFDPSSLQLKSILRRFLPEPFISMEDDSSKAAVLIQSAYRGFRVRQGWVAPQLGHSVSFDFSSSELPAEIPSEISTISRADVSSSVAGGIGDGGATLGAMAVAATGHSYNWGVAIGASRLIGHTVRRLQRKPSEVVDEDDIVGAILLKGFGKGGNTVQ